MKRYLVSIGAGLVAGLVYSLMGVRSPAPPTIALLGLMGILLGEQILPVAKRMFRGQNVVALVRTDCAERVLGLPLRNKPKEPRA